MQPGVVVVEVALALMVGVVGQLVELEHHRQVGQPPQLHLGCFCRVAAKHITARNVTDFCFKLTRNKV